LSGKEVWRFKTDSAVYDPPKFFGNNIYFGSWDCHLYCVDSESGQEVWRFTTSTTTKSYMPPPYECFETEVKIPASHEDIKEGKGRYDASTFGSELFGEYKSESPYKSKSAYKTKSDYK
jgi:hypothetical protein